MTVVFGYDSAGRSIPTETSGTDLNSNELGRLNGDTPSSATTPVPTIQETNASVLRAIGVEDKQIPVEKAAASTQRGNLYGSAGPFAGSFFPGQNPLHQYATYNYNISLHALGADEFNAIASGFFVPGNPLMHTGGGYRPRNSLFNEDFFIDNLEIISVVGAGEDNATSKNEVYYTWKIIEPMGMTLMNRIVGLGDSYYNGMPWPKIPYCLVIEFTGYLDDGQPIPLSNHTKLFPCTIVQMDIQPSAKGTEYNVKAVPYTHVAFAGEFGKMPCSTESDAKTLEDFFRADENAGVNADNRPIVKEEILGGEKEKVYKVRSLVSAYNNYQKGLVKNNLTDVADKVAVVFADEILKDMDVVPKETQQADRTPSPDRERKKVAGKQRTGTDPGGPKPTVGVFSFAAEDSIETIIDVMMQQSKYWRKQTSVFTKDKEKKAPEAAETRAWVIVPKLKLLKYDKQRGRPGYEVTFYVKVHVKYNREDPNLPKSWPKNVARIYEYAYSGRNQDVLTWDVKFNSLYTSTELVYPEKDTAISGPTPSADTSDKLQAAKAAAISGRSVAEAGGGAGEGPNNEVNPRSIVKKSNTSAATGANANKDSVGKVAANAYSNIYNKSAELNKVELTIVGDPAWMIQEENVIDPAADLNVPSKEYSGDGGANSGQVYFNKGAVHVKLIWKSPTDLDERTGGYGSGGFNQVILNGVYEVKTVKSQFQNGVFTQQLVMVRLVEQEEKEFNSASAALGLSYRDITEFPQVQTANVLVSRTEVKVDAVEYAPYRRGAPTMTTDGGTLNTVPESPAQSLRSAAVNYPTVTIPQAEQQGIAAFGQRYDIPISQPNPAVDPFNLPAGVVIDPATGLPNYQGNFYTGGQKDIAAWKQAVDAKQPFAWTNTLPNGNTGITRYPGT